MALRASSERLPATYKPPDWNKVASDFLGEKRERSGSEGTVAKYSSILGRFFGELGKKPDEVEPTDVHTFVHGVGPSLKPPSAATINLRLAALSSFYEYAERFGLPMPQWNNGHGGVQMGNPCRRVKRTQQEPPPPRGLSHQDIRRLFAAIPDTQAGNRDRAIILTCLLTGRRRSEIMSLKAGNLSRSGAAYYVYRGKGGAQKRRELPEPCFQGIVDALAARGKKLEDLADDERVFDVSAHGFYLNLRRYLRKAKLPEGGVHVLRHTAAKLRRDVGESVESVSRFLDHSNLAVTTTYLRRLEGDDDTAWRKVAALLE